MVTTISAHTVRSDDGQTLWLVISHGGSHVGLIVDEDEDDYITLAIRAATQLRKRRKRITTNDLIPAIREALTER